MPQTVTYTYLDNLPLNLTYYPSLTTTIKPAILYFHGGGLIYGQRDDLPIAYIHQLTAAGHPLITFDYPFVPEVRLRKLIDCLSQGILWFYSEAQATFGLSSKLFYYFGRSAGAYLALLLTKNRSLPQPQGLILFYGYYDLRDPELTLPSSYYNKYPAPSFMTIQPLIKKHPLVSARIEERFPLYLAYRQTGQWGQEVLESNQNLADFSLSNSELAQLPPSFLASSINDQDVPVRITQHMAQLIPDACLKLVDDLPHDFDANSHNPLAQTIYANLISWLA